MGFDFAKLLATQHSQARDAIGNPALMQLLEPRNLLGAGRDHELAALFEGNPMLLAEALHGRGPGDAVARLQRAGLVVEAGVDDSAVMSGLVRGHAIFFLHDDQRHLWKAQRDLESCRQSDNPGAND